MAEETWGMFEHPDGRRMGTESRIAAARLEREGFIYRGLACYGEFCLWVGGGRG